MSQSFKNDELTKTILETISERTPKDIRQLINILKGKMPFEEDEILNFVMELEKQGIISLQSQQHTASLTITSYLKSSQAIWYWTTIILVIITAPVVFFVPADFYPWNYMRNILGIIFILWLPGYVLIKAIFPENMPIKTSSEKLDAIERIMLSIGTSLAIVPMVGLILNYLPWGIRLLPVTLALIGLTLIIASAAAAREYMALYKLRARHARVHQ